MSIASAMLAHAQAHRWDEASSTLDRLCQAHVDDSTEDELVAILHSLVKAHCPAWAVSAIEASLALSSDVESDLDLALRRAVTAVSAQPDIKGLYCEYFYDGGDGSSMDLFPCRSFTRSNDDWAADFHPSDVVEGPRIQALLRYDPELELDPAPRFLATAYLHSVLLAMFVRVQTRFRLLTLPAGFAQHDFPIIYLRDRP